MGGNTQEVEEVFSRTIEAAWKGFDKFEHKSSYFTWLCRISLNKIADYYRDQVNERSVIVAPFLEEIANIEDKNISPVEKIALNELRRSVIDCLDLLPNEKRRLLYLRYWKEMSIRQIASIFGVSERSIEGKIYRAKKSLGEIIETKHPEVAEVFEQK